MLPESRRWYHIFWNPKAELYKYLANCAMGIQYSQNEQSEVCIVAREVLHEFACQALETEHAELQGLVNVGTVTNGEYRSSLVQGFSLISTSQDQ